MTGVKVMKLKKVQPVQKPIRFSLITAEEDKKVESALSLFQKRLSRLKEATDQLSFMMSEIHSVLENSHSTTRRQA